ncbi:MAG TPA: hypothetical protein VGQ19_20885 [Burkholderiales bacterium]|nr:hypothetical protein [Burkholderiales bacterium]
MTRPQSQGTCQHAGERDRDPSAWADAVFFIWISSARPADCGNPQVRRQIFADLTCFDFQAGSPKIAPFRPWRRFLASMSEGSDIDHNEWQHPISLHLGAVEASWLMTSLSPTADMLRRRSDPRATYPMFCITREKHGKPAIRASTNQMTAAQLAEAKKLVVADWHPE